MAPNPVIYCLEKITDYSEFERLCHDLVALEGYANVEPLGGFKDKGRDAIHVDHSGVTTIFAYSVREDWRAKLAEDAAKIHRHEHSCNQLMFLCTASFTAGERDEAVRTVASEYGWRLELVGLERLRILLEVLHPQVKDYHPQLFPPSMFQGFGNQGLLTKPDHIFISYVTQDEPLAEWLSRKLTAEGYLVWCERFHLLGGETYPRDVDTAIQEQTACVIGLYSQASLADPEIMRQRALALTIGKTRRMDFLIPIDIDGIEQAQLDRPTSLLTFVPFIDNWAHGLNQLLGKLATLGCPKSLTTGKEIAASTYLHDDVLADKAEIILSNCLEVTAIPAVIHRFQSGLPILRPVSYQLRDVWAYRLVNPNLFLSFHRPPEAIVGTYKIDLIDDIEWRSTDTIDGITTRDLVAELLRKSLIVKCHERGLQYCPAQKLHYFPWDLLPKNRLKYKHPNGSRRNLAVAGQRTFWRPSGAEKYHHYLAPNFFVVQNLFDEYTVLVKMRIRLSDVEGNPLPAAKIKSRRKHLCKDWWNNHWLNRIVAVCQFLAVQDQIICGESGEQVVIQSHPITVTAPVGINEDALPRASFERTESRISVDGEDEDEHAEVEPEDL